MFGLGDFSITAAYGGSILAALVCVVYGALNWNRSDEEGER